MSIVKQNSWFSIDKTDQYVLLSLTHSDFRVMGSCVLNGGATVARHILNLKVPRSADHHEAPEQTLQRMADQLGCCGPVSGMMTAASMDSFRLYEHAEQGVTIVVMVTCGLDNARCVADTAEYTSMLTELRETGTINMVMLTDAVMSDAAMVEAVQIMTEAKSAALANAKVRSPLSGRIATGTGTDAVAIVSAVGKPDVRYCGKHVRFGEVLGRLTLDAVQDSVSWYHSDGYKKSTTDANVATGSSS